MESITAPVLAFYGESDPMVTPAAAQALENEMWRLGKSIETHVYPKADHGFFNDDRPEVYDASAAQDAWDRTLGFFSKHLRT